MELGKDNMTEESKKDMKKKKKVLFFHSSKNRKIQVWTKEEDARLIEIGKEYDYKNWKEISKKMKNRTATQCSGRYKRIRPGIIKAEWTPEEDEQLMELISEYGKNWSLISTIISSRNSKQIRDRYINKLDKNVKVGKFTKEEDEKILMYYTKFGRKWTKIANFFSGRTGDMIKNRFYSCIRKKINHIKKIFNKNLEEDEKSNKEIYFKMNDSKFNKIKFTEVKEIEFLGEDTKYMTSHNNISFKVEEIQEFTPSKVEEFYIPASLIKPEQSDNYNNCIQRNEAIKPVNFEENNSHIQNFNYYDIQAHSYHTLNSNRFFKNSDYYHNTDPFQLKIYNNTNNFKPSDLSFQYIRTNNINEINNAQMLLSQIILKKILEQ